MSFRGALWPCQAQQTTGTSTKLGTDLDWGWCQLLWVSTPSQTKHGNRLTKGSLQVRETSRKNSSGKHVIPHLAFFSEMTTPKQLLEWRDSIVQPKLGRVWHSLRNRLLTKPGEMSSWQPASRKWLQILSLYLYLHVKATVVFDNDHPFTGLLQYLCQHLPLRHWIN